MIFLRKVLRLRSCCDSARSRAGVAAPRLSSSLSSAVGGIWALASVGGLKVVWVMASGPKIFALAEYREGFFSDAFKSSGENDESNVAVLGVGAGIRREAGGDRGEQ